MPTDKLTEYALSRGDLFVAILVLGFVIAILVGAIVLQYRDGKTCEKARLDDAKASIPVLDAANKAMAAITAEMSSRTTMAGGMAEAIRDLVEAQKKTSELAEKTYDFLRDDMARQGRRRT